MKEYKFNKLQLEWLAALESGEYSKGTGRLGDGFSHCCLGVARRAVFHMPCMDDHYLSGFETAQLDLRERCGELGEPAEVYGRECPSLAEINDATTWNFFQIADYIRSHPWNVFKGRNQQTDNQN